MKMSKNKIEPLHAAIIRELMRRKVGRSQYLSIIKEDGRYRVNFRTKYQEQFFVEIKEAETSITASFIRDINGIKEQMEDIISGLKLRYSMARNGIEIKLVDGFHQLTGNVWILSDMQIKKINIKLEQLDEMGGIIYSK